MQEHPQVERFTQAVRRRLNRHRLYNSLLWVAALAAAAMVAVALSYVIPGHAVPTAWYAWIAGGAVVLAALLWVGRRIHVERAARFADEFFGLKDAVVSCRHFAQSGKAGGFYNLQAEQTQGRIAQLQPAAIRYRLPRRLAGCALVLAVVAALLGFKSPSEAVQKKIAQETQTLEQTAQMNQELEELIDELEQQTDGTLEAELIDANELRRWVDELEETTDRKEALRQYAHLEQKLTEASSRLEQRREERLLDRAAKELVQDRPTKELAKKLEQKKYDSAAEELKELTPQEKKELSDAKKELARLKAAAGRMTAAAKALKKGQPHDGKAAEQEPDADDLADDEDGDLDELIEDLDEDVEQWEGDLEKIDLADAEFGEFDPADWEKAELERVAVAEDLERIGDRLKRLALKRRAQAKLKKLCRACSQCQSGLCKDPRAGGRKAGVGSNDAKRDQRDETKDNGQYTQLKGIKGNGPSLTKIEAAEDGDGVSTRRGGQRQRAFQRQVESFVQREDVPEDVKAGVKEYFKNIHQNESAATDSTAPDDATN